MKHNKRINWKKLSPRQKNLLGILGCSIAILGMLGFLFWLNRLNAKLAESQNWPSTTGVIVSTHVKQGSVTTGSGYSETTETVYIPALEYSYHLGGWDYTSDNITLGTSWGLDSFDTQAEAEVYLKEQYPIGTKVVVYYDPDNPREAFLFKKEPLFTGGISIIMYVIITFLLGIIVYVSLNLDKPLR